MSSNACPGAGLGHGRFYGGSAPEPGKRQEAETCVSGKSVHMTSPVEVREGNRPGYGSVIPPGLRIDTAKHVAFRIVPRWNVVPARDLAMLAVAPVGHIPVERIAPGAEHDGPTLIYHGLNLSAGHCGGIRPSGLGRGWQSGDKHARKQPVRQSFVCVARGTSAIPEKPNVSEGDGAYLLHVKSVPLIR